MQVIDSQWEVEGLSGQKMASDTVGIQSRALYMRMAGRCSETAILSGDAEKCLPPDTILVFEALAEGLQLALAK